MKKNVFYHDETLYFIKYFIANHFVTTIYTCRFFERFKGENKTNYLGILSNLCATYFFHVFLLQSLMFIIEFFSSSSTPS